MKYAEESYTQNGACVEACGKDSVRWIWSDVAMDGLRDVKGDADPAFRNDCCKGDGSDVCDCESDFLRAVGWSKEVAGEEERREPVWT